MITKKIISDDLCKIRVMLRDNDFEIPSLWSVLWPVLMFFLLIMMMQFSFCISYSGGFLGLKEGTKFSLVSVAIISLIACLAALNGRARYLCLPKSVRYNSVILKIMKKKVGIYTIVWVGIYFISGVTSVILNKKPSDYPVMGLFFGLVFLFFLFNIDMARFEISAFEKLYDLWKENKL